MKRFYSLLIVIILMFFIYNELNNPSFAAGFKSQLDKGISVAYNTTHKNIHSIQISTAHDIKTAPMILDRDFKNDGKRIRVGWFYSEGVHSLDAKGHPCGYDYDYLQAIAQYTDWEYEYVMGNWAECYEWLKNGDIDIMGVVNKTPERDAIFDYSYTSTGSELCCLFVREDDAGFAYEDFKSFDGMVIAVEEGTQQGDILRQYADKNNFRYIPSTFPSLREAQYALNDRRVDALLSSNTDIIQGYKCVARFSPIPFYFAVTKGNKELLSELDYGISQLLAYNPNFNNYLYGKYYGNVPTDKVVFSIDEIEYIKSNPSISVLIDPLWYPMESYDSESESFKGIVPAILDIISKNSGLNFTYEDVGSSVNALQTTSNSSETLITSITYDYAWASKNHLNITQPFMDASIVCVKRESKKTPKSVALVSVDYITEMIHQKRPNLKFIHFNSMAECIAAVADGKVDCTYMNNYEAEYYMTIPKYKGLSFRTTDMFRQKISLGISETADPRLFSIVSKCLQNISLNEIANIIYDNSYHVVPMTLISFIQYNPLTVFAIVMIFVLIILSGLYAVLRSNLRNTKILSIENARFNQLSNMTNEHIYEYNYATDTLSFNTATHPLFQNQKLVENYSMLIENYVSAGIENFEDTLYSCFKDRKDLTKVINLQFTNGMHRRCRVTNKVVYDDNSEAVYAIGKIQDIQEEYEEMRVLIEQAQHDSLTGIYNTKTFREKADSSIAPGALLMLIDIDYFKSINDTYGHYNGDLALVSIANILKDLLGSLGFAGRLGGDEFAVFIPEGMKEQELIKLCEETVDRVKKISFRFEEKELSPITVSMGVTSAEANEVFTDLYKRADKLLYQVKACERNGFRIG